MPLAAVPVTAKFTVREAEVSPVRLIVNVPVSGPVSLAAESVAVTVTTGGSLSTMVTVSLLGEPTT